MSPRGGLLTMRNVNPVLKWLVLVKLRYFTSCFTGSVHRKGANLKMHYRKNEKISDEFASFHLLFKSQCGEQWFTPQYNVLKFTKSCGSPAFRPNEQKWKLQHISCDSNLISHTGCDTLFDLDFCHVWSILCLLLLLHCSTAFNETLFAVLARRRRLLLIFTHFENWYCYIL